MTAPGSSSTPDRALRVAAILAAAGGAALALGFLVAPDRAWMNLLLASFALVGLGLAGLFFVAFEYVTGAGWSVAFRRVPEAMTALLPAGALGLAAVFLLHPSIYPWTAPVAGKIEAVAHFKHWWLSRPFFLLRAAIYLAIWIVLGRAIVRTSRRQDQDGALDHTRRNARLSAIFLVLAGFTVWLASYDWIMSLEPDWSSTIFGVYHFAGMFTSGLAVIILLVIWLSKRGPLHDVVNPAHLQDLGTLLFAFSTFWAYIWFSQYMLIWYANIPEETVYFTRRMHGIWATLFLMNLLLNWAVPFLALLPRRHKRDPAILGKVALVVLAGRWLDLYLSIFPPFTPARPLFGVWELGALAAVAGGSLLLFHRAFCRASPVPLRDPLLAESVHVH